MKQSMKQSGLLLFCVLTIAMCTVRANADVTRWNFESNDLAAKSGPASLSYNGGTITSDDVSFGLNSDFGLPDLDGTTFAVMSLDTAFRNDQSLILDPASSANGGGNFINDYTLGYDILIPNEDPNWFSFYNTNDTNSNDGDAFINPGGGIGISGNYDGTVNVGQWNRIVLAVGYDSADDTTYMSKYLNGALLEKQDLGSSVDGRWSLYPSGAGNTHIFGDDSGDTNPAFIGSLLFASRTLTDAEVANLGGPTADGFAPVPEPSSLIGLGIVGLIAFGRRRRS
jgi:hypothetical protein